MAIDYSDYDECKNNGYNWQLSNSRYEEIKEIIVSVFEKYNVNCVPVSGFELAKKMGINVIPYKAYKPEIQLLLKKKSRDGFCAQKQDGSWFIFYNGEQDYCRVNNTMLHEIGHIVLDHSEDSDLAEKEVKFFAKYALVPPVLVHKLRLTSIDQIANVFGVSFQAANYAWKYYKKWADSHVFYTPYEIKLTNLFANYLLGGGVS